MGWRSGTLVHDLTFSGLGSVLVQKDVWHPVPRSRLQVQPLSGLFLLLNVNNNNNDNRRLVTRAEHTPDHSNQTNSSSKEQGGQD